MPLAIGYCFRILCRHLLGENLLEMGPAEGVMTELLATTGKSMTVVEGSALFCNDLRARFPQAQVINALFEDFEPTEQFDTIIMGHVLEHVQEPVDILLRARGWLKPGGLIFAAVPNAQSLHRQAAVIMGMLPRVDALNAMDLHHGHRRVFNPETFRLAFTQAGLQVDIFGGYWLKPLANGQIESHWNSAMIEAFMQLGERYPDIAGELYIVASVTS
ncbi:MAG: class I SAM-dependent methyltransferase [Candidatus Accumulibacter sp.]|nr:class I SAM-dependent methyltransferase [Accumulibacter sp.]MBO3715862.1 class I SAM-dependent methyltransferase [Accumulibacter sp.]